MTNNLDEMVAEQIKRWDSIQQINHAGQNEAVTTLSVWLAVQDVLGLPKKDDCPIEGCTNKYEAGEVAGYDQALNDLRQAISTRLGGKSES